MIDFLFTYPLYFFKISLKYCICLTFLFIDVFIGTYDAAAFNNFFSLYICTIAPITYFFVRAIDIFYLYVNGNQEIRGQYSYFSVLIIHVLLMLFEICTNGNVSAFNISAFLLYIFSAIYSIKYPSAPGLIRNIILIIYLNYRIFDHISEFNKQNLYEEDKSQMDITIFVFPLFLVYIFLFR